MTVVRWIVGTLVATLLAWLSLSSPVTGLTPLLGATEAVYAYNTPGLPTGSNNFVSERGPPTLTYDHADPPVAVDHATNGASPRPQPVTARARTTYDHGARSAQLDNGRATTGTATDARRGGLRPVPAASVAAEAGGAGWRLGDDVYAATKAGKIPAWSTVRGRFWKNTAADPKLAGQWDEANLARMRSGRATATLEPREGWDGVDGTQPRAHFVPRWGYGVRPSLASGSRCGGPVPIPGVLTVSTKLADLFQASRGEPVEWDGQDVHMMYELAGPAADQELLIRFGQPSPARGRALRIRARGGLLEVNGQALDDVVLWSDSTTESVVVGFRPARADKPMTVRIWNAWRDPAGTMQAWIGNSGMLIEEQGGSTVLRCSDGFDDPTFDDLVASLSLSSK